MQADASTLIREGLELFSHGEFEASISKLAPSIEWDTSAAVPDRSVYRGRDQGWWVEDGLPVRDENFADRERAWRAPGLDPEPGG